MSTDIARPRCVVFLIGLTIAVLATHTAKAQGGQITIKDFFDLFTEEKTLTTAARHEQKQTETTFSTTILTREDLRAMGITNTPLLLTLILKTVPGFNAPSIGPQGTRVKVRGNGAPIGCSVKFLLNGTDASDTIVHGMELISLPFNVDEIERIEIVRGPGTVLHGPSATQGVVNFITKTPEGNEGTHILAGGGVVDNIIASASQRGSRGNLSYSFHIGGNRQASFMDRDYADLENVFTRLYLRKTLEESNLILDASFTNGSKADYALFFGLNRVSRWRGALDFRYSRSLVTFKTTYRITHRSQTPISDPIANPPDLMSAPFDARDQVAEHEITAALAPARKLFTVFGGGYRYENVEWDLLENGGQDQHKLYAYINNEYKVVAPLTFVFGIRVDASDFTPAEWSGNLGLVYRLSEKHTIRALAGNSAYDPAYKVAFIQTRNLRPVRHMLREKNKSAELGYQGSFGDRVKFEAVGYHVIKYHGVTFAPLRGGFRLGANTGSNGFWGAESSLEVLISRQISSWVNYTFASARNRVGPNPLDLTSPKHLANGGVKTQFGKFLGHVWLNFVDESIPAGGRATRAPAHTLLNMAITYDLSDDLELFVSGYNLTNNKSREDNIFTERLTRIVTGGLRLRF